MNLSAVTPNDAVVLAGDQVYADSRVDSGHAGALRRAVIEGDVENGSVMAGQSVGMVHVERPVVDIIAKLVDEANTALAR